MIPLLALTILQSPNDARERALDPDRLVAVRIRLQQSQGLVYNGRLKRFDDRVVVWRDPDAILAVRRAFSKTPQVGNPITSSQCAFYKADDPVPRYAGDVALDYSDVADRPILWRLLKRRMVAGLDALSAGSVQITVQTSKHRFAVPSAQARRFLSDLRGVPDAWVGAVDLPVRSLAVGGKARDAHFGIEAQDGRGDLTEATLAVPRSFLESPPRRPSALVRQLLRAYRAGGALPDVDVGPDGGDPPSISYGRAYPPPPAHPFKKPARGSDHGGTGQGR